MSQRLAVLRSYYNRMNTLMIVTMCIMKYHMFFHYVIVNLHTHF